MSGEARNLQNEFFNQARKERMPVTVYLANGKKLVGRIKSFDKFTILLDGQYGEQMVFKHAISTVSAGARSHGPAAETERAETAPASGQG